MRKLLAILVCLGVAASMAACGGGDDSAATQTKAASTTTATTSEPTDKPTTDVTAEPTATEDGSSGGGSEVDSCTLLTPAEISQALGFGVSDGHKYAMAAAGESGCEFPGTEVSGSVFVGVLTDDGSGWYDSVHYGEEGTDVQKVEGIGDKASYNSFTDVLDVAQGANYVEVQLAIFFSSIDRLTAAKGLAQAILQKLG